MEKLNKTTDLKRFLESGKLTQEFFNVEKLKKELEKISKKREEQNLDSDIEQCLLEFVHQNLTLCEDKDFVINNQFSRSAQEIFESKFATGCTDFAYVFASLARQMGIPTTILQTAQKEWTNKLINNIGDFKKHYGHTFCECFVNGKWILVDPTTKNIDWKYDESNSFKIRTEWKVGASKTFLPYFRGLDLEKRMNLNEFLIKENEIVKEQFSQIYDTEVVKKRFEQVNTPEMLKDFMDEILSYGYIDTQNIEHTETMHGVENHRVLSIEEIFNYKYETCAEAAKFAKYWFVKNGYECKLFFERIKRREHETDKYFNHSTHFYILFKDKKKGWCRFEQSSGDLKTGVLSLGDYSTALKHIVEDVEITRQNQIDYNKDRDVDFDTYGIYEFKDIKDGWTYRNINKTADKSVNILNEQHLQISLLETNIKIKAQ